MVIFHFYIQYEKSSVDLIIYFCFFVFGFFVFIYRLLNKLIYENGKIN